MDVSGRLGVKADMGGKTGTTNYNADGWFMALPLHWYPDVG